MLWQDPATAGRRAQPRLGGAARAARRRRSAGGSASATRRPRRCASAATPPRPGRRGARFQTSDGVGCESCHGAASGWLPSHYAVGGTHAANVVARPRPARQSARARRAAASTAISAAPTRASSSPTGSWPPAIPRISFELDLFSTLQQHHNDDGDYRQPQGPRPIRPGSGRSARRWRSTARSPCSPAARGTEGMFPEFYFFDCHSCHRRISDDPRFRPARARQSGPADPVRHAAVQRREHDHAGRRGAGGGARPRPALRARQPRLPRRHRPRPRLGRRRRADAAAERAGARRRLRRGGRWAAARPSRSSTAITGNALRERFTDYAGSVQAVMATDTLLSALVNQGQSRPAPASAHPGRHQRRLSRGPRSQCLRSRRLPGEPRPGGGGDPEG